MQGIHSILGLGSFLGAGYRLPLILCLLFLSFNEQAIAGSQAVSIRNPSVLLPSGGNGPSTSPQITPDGRFVLFNSSASDLVTNASGMFVCNLFLRDRVSNTTTLVSANQNGASANGDSTSGQVSTNGGLAVFQSSASDLIVGDTNGVSDIFVRNLQTGSTILVSVATDGGLANGPSTSPMITPDGRYVVFVSAATNLVANDTNGLADIFVRDLVNNTTTWVTTNAVKATRNFTITSPVMAPESPVISADGRYVAFYSTNDFGNGVPFTGSPYYSVGEVYVRDLVANTTIWASSNAVAMAYANISGNKFPLSSHPVISADGRFITFKTSLADRTAPTAIFRLDLSSGELTMLTTNSLPTGNGIRQALVDDLYGPEMTSDGQSIAFGNRENGTNNSSLWVWNYSTGTNTVISADLNGNIQTNASALAPALNGDGRFVAFVSNATNLVNNPVVSGYHVYLRDLQAGTNQLVDVDTNGAGSTDLQSVAPVLSSDAQYIAFATTDGGFVAGDNNQTFDVFLRNTSAASTELVSQRSQVLLPSTGNALSSIGSFSISADGRRTVYASYASDLVTNDFNNDRDVFMADLQSGATTLISVGLDGNAALGGSSTAPVISADGHFVAFASAATNLVVNDTNGAADIFLRNLDTGVTTLINVNSNGVTSGTGDASAPSISADGRYVAFLAKATPSTTIPTTFWKDTIGGRMATINSGSASAPGPSISADGQRVLWFSTSTLLNVWNAPTLATIYTFNSGSVSSAILSPTGTRVAYQYPSSKQFVVYNIAGGTNLFSCVDATPMKSSPAWSRDGRYVVFVTGAPLTAYDNNGTNDVYLCDLQTGMVNLISANSGWTASANDISDSPSISGDARFTVFRSFATDLLPGITNVPSLFVFDRTTGSNTLVATASPTSWTASASTLIVSSNGNTVAFQSWNVATATNDFNRVQDIYALAQDSLVTDTDADGIPDWWMLKYFGHALGQQNDLSRATDDADGDGLNNLQEFIAGLDPTNPNAVLALQISPGSVSSNTVSLTWPAVPGKSYQVQFKDDLKFSTWTNYSGSVSIIGRQGFITVPASQATRFFRAACVN